MYKRLTLLLALAIPAVAAGGARTIPLYDLSTPKDTLKHAKKFQFKLEGKPKTYPKRVAIGSFHARYVFKTTEGNRDEGLSNLSAYTTYTLEFDEATYAHITTALYAQLQERLEAEGFEVVPMEEVTATAAYQALEADGESRDNDRRAVHVPTGMKNLPVRGSGPARPGRLAALNEELGTDAVVTAFVNFGICNVEPTKKTEFRSGVYACLRGNLAQSGFDIRLLGGAKGSGDKLKPEWTARMFKETEMYDYNKRDNLVYDTALIARHSAATAERRNWFWGGWNLNSEQANFVGGAVEVYGDALDMGFARWEDKHGRAREAAGLTRSEPPDPFERTLEAYGVAHHPELAAVEPIVLEPTGPVTVRGESSCWTGSSTNGELVVRRWVDAEGMTLFEEQQVTSAAGPYVSRSEWTVSREGEGPFKASVRDAAGAFSGTATFTGEDWADAGYTLSGELTAAKAPFEATYTVEGDRIEGVTVMTINGADITVETELTRADDAACAEVFAE